MDGYIINPNPKSKTERSLMRRKKLKREYNEWILDGNLYDKKKESSITLGVVPGVVVEERRLDNMMYELARQRHMYNSQHNYNKKIFLDTQMNKSESMRRALQHESLSRGWSVGDREVSFDDSSEGMSVEHGYVPKYSEKGILSRTRVQLMNKGEENRKSDFQWLTLPPIDSKPNSRENFTKTVKFDTLVSTSSPQHSAHNSQPVSRMPTFERFPSMHRERSKSLPSTFQVPWSTMKSTNIQPGNCLPPVKKDSRFSKLESLLYPTYYGSTNLQSVSVSSLVNKCDSLKIPVVGDAETSKKDKERRIKQFLIQMGILTA